jgi:hypothetical protein
VAAGSGGPVADGGCQRQRERSGGSGSGEEGAAMSTTMAMRGAEANNGGRALRGGDDGPCAAWRRRWFGRYWASKWGKGGDAMRDSLLPPAHVWPRAARTQPGRGGKLDLSVSLWRG